LNKTTRGFRGGDKRAKTLSETFSPFDSNTVYNDSSTLGHISRAACIIKKKRKTDESRETISFSGDPPPVIAPNINVLDLGVARLRYLVKHFGMVSMVILPLPQ
jgi:hypothetical protein